MAQFNFVAHCNHCGQLSQIVMAVSLTGKAYCGPCAIYLRNEPILNKLNLVPKKYW